MPTPSNCSSVHPDLAKDGALLGCLITKFATNDIPTCKLVADNGKRRSLCPGLLLAAPSSRFLAWHRPHEVWGLEPRSQWLRGLCRSGAEGIQHIGQQHKGDMLAVHYCHRSHAMIYILQLYTSWHATAPESLHHKIAKREERSRL